VQVAQALQAARADEVWEFGAGSGALAAQLLPALDALGSPVRRYTVIEVSGSLRARQQARLAAFGDRVRWVDTLPRALDGVALGNEVLDAMPAQLLAFDGRDWHERGVAVHDGRFVFADRPTSLRPPEGCGPFLPGTQIEVQPQAQAFVATLARHLRRGMALFIDYGFPQAEFYLPQRLGGTLMCHRAHRADADPLVDVGLKDITVHVDFSAIALAAQDAGLEVAGYTSQARFLINCGIVPMLAPADAREQVQGHRAGARPGHRPGRVQARRSHASAVNAVPCSLPWMRPALGCRLRRCQDSVTLRLYRQLYRRPAGRLLQRLLQRPSRRRRGQLPWQGARRSLVAA
jgi:SAM-dependent MidA family methyltransferase